MALDIKSFTRDELATHFTGLGQPAYRVDQVLDWLYDRRATEWKAMSNLPKVLREQLSHSFSLQTLELVRKQGAHDSTQKFLWRLPDHALIESVLIPANPALYGEVSDRHTLCVSTQVGCAYGCKFCASGLNGWKRNLLPWEIVEQVQAVERWHQAQSSAPPSPAQSPSEVEGMRGKESAPFETLDHSLIRPADTCCRNGGEGGNEQSGFLGRASERRERVAPAFALHARLIDNLVIMGMGEPLANYENLLKALRILNAPWGGGIGARKITLSTSGLAPQIRRLADEPEQFRLAISLHGATDEVRTRIMPVNRKFPLAELTAALSYYQSRKGKLLTFEFILIAGVNDSLAQVKPLAALAKQLYAKVNLIPYNTVGGLEWQRPAEAACEAFLAALQKQKVIATLRREKGHDIDAACGQLRLKTEQELARAR